jgi:hypothetical protein
VGNGQNANSTNEQLENKITLAQKTINEAANKKQIILKHYL